MTQPSTDRRCRESRSRLKEALLALIKVKRYEEVTIADILEHADVGRSTFYSHFRSKEDLLFYGFDRWLASHGEALGDRGSRFGFSVPLLEHMRGQSGMFRAAVRGVAGIRLRRKAKQVLTGVIEAELRRLCPAQIRSALHAVHARMLAGAFLDLSDWWQNEAPDLAATQVDQMFQDFAIGALGNRVFPMPAST